MTTMENFLGIPIDGKIERDRRVEQKPLSELEPLIRAVLNDPTIHSFGWTQYTPYFNDGEPCVFRVGEVWVKTVDDVPKDGEEKDEDDYDDDEEKYWVSYGVHPSLGGRDSKWNGSKRVEMPYQGPDEARYDRCLKLSKAIDTGAFDHVLLDAFGDHANVCVRADGITIEFYEHD